MFHKWPDMPWDDPREVEHNIKCNYRGSEEGNITLSWAVWKDIASLCFELCLKASKLGRMECCRKGHCRNYIVCIFSLLCTSALKFQNQGLPILFCLSLIQFKKMDWIYPGSIKLLAYHNEQDRHDLALLDLPHSSATYDKHFDKGKLPSGHIGEFLTQTCMN